MYWTMKKGHSDLTLWGKNCIRVSPEELAERCSTKKSTKEQLYDINAQETIHRNPVFLDFLNNRPAPNTNWGRKRRKNYRYVK